MGAEMTEQAIPVISKGLSLNGAGSWAVFLMIILALIKTWPIIHLQAIKAKEALRGERRDEIADLRKDIETLTKELTEVQIKLSGAELRVDQYEFALRLATNEIERRIPDSEVPAQIRSLLASAVPKPHPSGIDQNDMDILRGGLPS